MHGFETILPFLKPIEHLILDPSVSEVMVNGADSVFIEKGGYLEPVSGVSLGEKALLVAVKNIARRLGGDISESHPILDSRLPDGSRVAAVIPPSSLNGVTLTIRKFNTRHFEIEDLIARGTLDQALANRLEDCVLSRKNILISGGTGSGKTTTLNILSKFIPEEERILLIEDTAEIHLAHANLVRFEARPPQNGLPRVAIRDLLKAALRHRRTTSCSVRFAAGRPSICCSFSTPATRGRCLRFTRIPQSKPSRDSRAACSKAASSCPTARSKAISPTRSRWSCRSSGGRGVGMSRKSSKSAATIPMPISSTARQSIRNGRHTRDALRPGKPKSRFFNRVHPRELSPVGSRRNPVAQSGPHRSTHRHGGKDHRTFLRGVAP